jgi:hypothetical protein
LLSLLVLSGNYWVPQGIQGVTNNNFTENFIVKAYPNPFHSFMTVSITGSSIGAVSLIIHDVFGKTCYQTEEVCRETNFEKSIDLTGLAPGVYYLTAKLNGEKREVMMVNTDL